MIQRVLTIGTFDLLHAGHIRLFKRAAKYGELIVGVNSDEFVSKYKGVKPQHNTTLRRGLVGKVSCVSCAVTNADEGASLVRAIRPDVLVVGSDWLDNGYAKQIGMSVDELDELDVEVVFLPRTPGVSSTIKRRQ